MIPRPEGPLLSRSTKEKNMKRLSCLMLVSLLSMAVLAGCNTVAGAGKDVQKAGEKVEDAATR